MATRDRAVVVQLCAERRRDILVGSARTRGGVTTSRRVTGGAQEHQSVNAHARSAAAADELLLAVRIASASTAVLYGRCDPGSAVSTRGPKAGQRLLAAMRRARRDGSSSDSV